MSIIHINVNLKLQLSVQITIAMIPKYDYSGQLGEVIP